MPATLPNLYFTCLRQVEASNQPWLGSGGRGKHAGSEEPVPLMLGIQLSYTLLSGPSLRLTNITKTRSEIIACWLIWSVLVVKMKIG